MDNRRSLFSWSKEQLEHPGNTFEFMQAGNIAAIFQHITSYDSNQMIEKFLDKAKTRDVYFLVGDPQWALDKHATELLKVIERIGPHQGRIKGMVIDVEPYLLDEFTENPQRVMARFVADMKTAYWHANRFGLEVILCLPYFFDQLGFEKEVEELISEASDAIAIMNYYRGKEREHMETEARLSLKHRKPIYNIYELQPPGPYGVKPDNTYYQLGIRMVEQQFEQLRLAFPNQAIHLSFHEYRYFKELLERKK